MDALGLLALNTGVMFSSAEFWARARRLGKPTASDKALDGDVILMAQAAFVSRCGYRVQIATTNVGHPPLFADARLWSEILSDD